MKTYLRLFICLGLVACDNTNQRQDNPISLVVTVTCTQLELFPFISQTDSLLSLSTEIKEPIAKPDSSVDTLSLAWRLKRKELQNKTKVSHVLLDKLHPIIYSDESGQVFLSESAFLGYSAPTDTNYVLNALLSSTFMPKNIRYEWIELKKGEVYALCGYGANEKSFSFSNPDVDTIKISRENILSDYFVSVKLKSASLDKIKLRRCVDDGVLIKVSLNNRKFIFSQKLSDLMNSGAILGTEFNRAFVDSLEDHYSGLVR
ncbi:MAG: hypothetical protein ACXVPN_03885 [Bacteroidia bacterium]